MYNIITAHECEVSGISRSTLVAAQLCCLTMLSRGIFTVTRRCVRHGDFHSAIDDRSVLDLRRSLAERASVKDSEQLRRMEHLGVLDAYRRFKPDDVIGGTSAAIIHGIPLSPRFAPRRTTRNRKDAGGREHDSRVHIGLPGQPVRIEVWNGRRGYTSPWIVRRQAHFEESQLVSWQGMQVTSAVRTAIDLARIGTVLDGLVACDWLLADAAGRYGPDGRERMRAAFCRAVNECGELRGVLRARSAVHTATGLSESVAESITLHRLHGLGLSHIRQQVVIRDEDGAAIARVDFLVASSDGTPVVIEVDGALKYAGHTGDDRAQNPLFKEKRREDAIRRMGYRVVRLVWADLGDMSRMRKLLRSAHISC